MSVRTDTVNLNVNINGNKALNELNNLRKRAADIKFEMSGLAKGTAEYAAKARELAAVTVQMTALRKEIGLTALNQKELQNELKKLNAMRSSITPFTAEYKELSRQIKEVSNRLYEVKNGVQGFAAFFSKIKDEVKQFGVLAAGYLGFQFVTQQFTNLISGAGKLSDSLADIRKNTGLTAAEVAVLNKELKGMDTRTSNQALRDLAVDAGKLGIEGKQNIKDFIEAANQINVALGEDLGKEAVKDIGKLVDVFRLKEEFGLKESMLKVGSAINEVGANSSASESYIVEFMKRMGGIAPAAKIPIADLVGLAGTLDSLGQMAEVSTTALGNTISKLATNFSGFAKLAGVSAAELQKTFSEKGGLAAMIQVLDGVKKAGGGFDELVAMLGDVGIEGSRAKSVFAVLSNNLDKLDAQIKIANDSFNAGISLTEEYNIKNETFGATLEKLSKEFNSLMTSPAVVGFLQSAVEGALKFIAALKDLPATLRQFRTEIIIVTGLMLAYNAEKIKAIFFTGKHTAAKILENLQFKAEYYWLTITEGASKAYAFAKGVLTGKITLATAAQRIWNATAAANPIGAIILGLTALAAVISALTSKVAQLTTKQRVQNELQKKILEATAEEESKAKSLFQTLQQKNLSYDAKKKLVQDLIALNPKYLSGLTAENVTTAEGAKLMNNYIEKLREAHKEKARQALLEEKRKKLTDLENANAANGPDGGSELGKIFKDIGAGLGIGSGSAGYQFNQRREEIIQLKKELDELYKQEAESIQKKLEDTSTQTVTQVQGSVSKTIADLKKQIQDLDTAFEGISIADKGALKANRSQRNMLQTQLDALMGKSENKSENDFERLKKEAEKFQKELEKIKKKAIYSEEDEMRREVDAVEEKYAALIAKAKDYFLQHATTKKQYDEQEKMAEEAKQAELNKIFSKFAEERRKKAIATEYDQSLENLNDYSEGEKNKLGIDYAKGLISKKQYEQGIRKIEFDAIGDRIKLHEQYSKDVAKAAENLKKDKAKLESETTKNLMEESEIRKAFTESEKTAKAKRDVLNTRQGTDAHLRAVKSQLELEFAIKTEGWEKESEAYKLAQDELREQMKEADAAHWESLIDNVMNYVGMFQNALTQLHQFITARENRLLQDEKRRNEEKKKGLRDQLDRKLISRAQYDLKSQKLDEDQERKEKEIKRKQAAREKALNLFRAIIDNAAAILKTMATVAYPFNIPLAIAQGIAGGMQIAAIANAPLPELGSGGLIENGPYHSDSDKGLHLINPRTGKTEMLLEKDEGVINGKAMRDAGQYTVTGTPSQIASALNAMSGGVNWAAGAVVEMAKYNQTQGPRLSASLPRIMEQGGIIRDLQPISEEVTTDTNSADGGVAQELKALRADMRNWRQSLKAVVSIKEFREEEKKYDDSKKAAGL